MEILVVDDDPGSVATYTTWLSARGHKVLTASNGRAAMQRLRNTSVNLVLLDLYMPDMDGFEVLREIKAGAPKTKVIVMSGSAHALSCNFLKAAVSFGAHSVLRKPFTLDNLLSSIAADEFCQVAEDHLHSLTVS